MNKEMEKYVDEGYAECDKREALENIIALHIHGEENYYFKHPEEFEKDKQIYDMEYLGVYNYDDSEYYIEKPEEFEKDNQIYLLKQENDMLKEEIEALKNQLENAIIPKFKIGQEVYFINEYKKIETFKITKIEGICFRYYDDIGFWVGEQDLFETKKEAKNQLEKLKEENNE